MMMRKGRPKRSHRAWFWRSRRNGPPAVVEQDDAGRWRVFIGNREVGSTTTREGAEQLVAKLDAKKERL